MESESTGWPGLVTLAAAGPRFLGRDWVLLVALFVTLIVVAASAAAETALTSLNRIRLRNLAEEGDKRAQRIVKLHARPQSYLTTILVMSNVAVITASTLATIIAVDVSFNGAEILSTILLSLVVLIFCEITPKNAALQAPERWAYWLIGPVEAAIVVLTPLVRALSWITSHLIARVFGRQARRHPSVTESELRMMVEVSGEEGVLEEEASEMIDNVFELAETSVREVMVPRVDMVTIDADATVEEATRLILQGGQSRVPMYEEDSDDIIGVLYAKDLLRSYASNQRPASVRALARPAFFVPESKRLDDLLREMREQRVHMAIVVDEYGAPAGLVTIEDLVEEVIGDIKDEYDVEEQAVEKVGENEFIIDPTISLDEFQEEVGRELPEESYDRVGGFVYAQLDKIPTVGDTFRFKDMAFTVLSTKGRRITKIKVVRGLPPEESPPAAGEGGNGEPRPATAG